MARRRKKSKTRRKKQGISVIGLAETYMLVNVATQALFNTNPITFVMGSGSKDGYNAAGLTAISLKELFQMSQVPTSSSTSFHTTNVIKKNFEANWPNALAGMVLIPVGFKLGKNFARPAISRTNRLLNKSGIGSTVKL